MSIKDSRLLKIVAGGAAALMVLGLAAAVTSAQRAPSASCGGRTVCKHACVPRRTDSFRRGKPHGSGPVSGCATRLPRRCWRSRSDSWP